MSYTPSGFGDPNGDGVSITTLTVDGLNFPQGWITWDGTKFTILAGVTTNAQVGVHPIVFEITDDNSNGYTGGVLSATNNFGINI